MNFYISDTHFGHKNILKFDNRPFLDTKEMEDVLIKNWNAAVSKNDTTYILGDFCWSKDKKEWQRILESLNGNKVLILGNHDLTKYPAPLSNLFQDIKEYKEIVDDGYKVIMCHYPILAYKHSYDPNTFMLFGHVHNRTKESAIISNFIKQIRDNYCEQYDNRGQLINVGCMMSWMNYSPQTLSSLIKKLDGGHMY